MGAQHEHSQTSAAPRSKSPRSSSPRSRSPRVLPWTSASSPVVRSELIKRDIDARIAHDRPGAEAAAMTLQARVRERMGRSHVNLRVNPSPREHVLRGSYIALNEYVIRSQSHSQLHR